MPRMSERDRLTELEARQRRVAEEIDQVRAALRGRYAAIVLDLAVEGLTEREFRDIVTHAIRLGGPASIGALSANSPDGERLRQPLPVRRLLNVRP